VISLVRCSVVGRSVEIFFLSSEEFECKAGLANAIFLRQLKFQVFSTDNYLRITDNTQNEKASFKLPMGNMTWYSVNILEGRLSNEL